MKTPEKEKNGTRRSLSLFFMLMLCLFAASGCQKKEEEGLTTLERIRKEGVIRVGYANEAPYAFYDSKADRLTGEAPEIAREIAKRMGIGTIDGVLTEFGALIPGLKAKRFDIIAAGMYILPERCREIAFTRPTYKVGEAFLVKKGNPLALHSYEDVAMHPTARLGVVAGAVELSYAHDTGVPKARITILPDVPSAVAAVNAGRIDAYAGTSLTINDIMRKTSEKTLERATPFRDPVIADKQVVGYGAFGIRTEDGDLRETFNQHLKTYIGSQGHRELVIPFGLTEAELPGEMTAERLCAG